MRRALRCRCLGLLGWTLLSTSACVDRQAGIDDELEAACAPVNAWAFFSDGTQQYMYDADGENMSVCTCVESESSEDAKSPEVEAELREAALEECLAVAEVLYPDAVSNDCAEYYSPGNELLYFVLQPGHDHAHLVTPGLPCFDDGTEPRGCSVRPTEEQTPLWALILTLGLGVSWTIRRRTSRRSQAPE